MRGRLIVKLSVTAFIEIDYLYFPASFLYFIIFLDNVGETKERKITVILFIVLIKRGA